MVLLGARGVMLTVAHSSGQPPRRRQVPRPAPDRRRPPAHAPDRQPTVPPSYSALSPRHAPPLSAAPTSPPDSSVHCQPSPARPYHHPHHEPVASPPITGHTVVTARPHAGSASDRDVPTLSYSPQL